jgi:hypothetical protein
MAKAAPPIEAGMAVPNPLNILKDIFLFSGDYKFMFYVALAGFCAANARAILTASPKINYFHGCALMVLTCYGGSTISAIMVGAPVVFAVNEALVSVSLTVWTVMYLAPDMIIKLLKDTTIGSYLNSACYEIMRCHVLMNCSKQAATILPAALAVPSADRVAIIGPLIAGTLGGCGGGFMPLNKGLDPLAGGTNWRILSAMIASTWLFLSMQYPDSKAMIGVDGDTARFIAVSFCVVMPIIQSVTGFAPLGANPLVPPKPAAASAGKKNK